MLPRLLKRIVDENALRAGAKRPPIRIIDYNICWRRSHLELWRRRGRRVTGTARPPQSGRIELLAGDLAGSGWVRAAAGLYGRWGRQRVTISALTPIDEGRAWESQRSRACGCELRCAATRTGSRSASACRPWAASLHPLAESRRATRRDGFLKDWVRSRTGASFSRAITRFHRRPVATAVSASAGHASLRRPRSTSMRSRCTSATR